MFNEKQHLIQNYTVFALLVKIMSCAVVEKDQFSLWAGLFAPSTLNNDNICFTGIGFILN